MLWNIKQNKHMLLSLGIYQYLNNNKKTRGWNYHNLPNKNKIYWTLHINSILNVNSLRNIFKSIRKVLEKY